MANSAQARKRARQSDTRRRHNASQRSTMRTTLKKAISAIATGNYEQSVNAFEQAAPLLDKAVSQGIISKNKAARHKSRLNTQIKALKA